MAWHLFEVVQQYQDEKLLQEISDNSRRGLAELVSLRDNGAHRDMNATTFMRSVFALRHYFAQIALAGMRKALVVATSKKEEPEAERNG